MIGFNIIITQEDNYNVFLNKQLCFYLQRLFQSFLFFSTWRIHVLSLTIYTYFILFSCNSIIIINARITSFHRFTKVILVPVKKSFGKFTDMYHFIGRKFLLSVLQCITRLSSKSLIQQSFLDCLLNFPLIKCSKISVRFFKCGLIFN